MRRRCDNRSQPGEFWRNKLWLSAGVSGLIAQVFGVLLTTLAIHGFDDGVARAQETIVDERREYNVKAVSLYAFGRYVTWPNSAFTDGKSQFVIGVLGGNPFGDSLERIAAKKTLNGRSIVVRPLSAVKEINHCHIVFVTRSVAAETQNRLFQEASGKPILLVGETPGFADRGGVINFYQSGTNVRFELNPEKGAENQLSLNAKLLSLGTKTSSRK